MCVNKKINTVYFSATDTTRKVVWGIARKIADNSSNKTPINNFDFTLPEGRKIALSFTKEDIVIIGVPVYAGRVPNVLLQYLSSITGNGALAIAVVTYGNRNYDDALIELTDILALDGFNAVAGGAFIGEHSFSKTLAKNRPDEKDISVVSEFAERIYRKITTQDTLEAVVVKGNRPYRPYYIPKDGNNQPADIRKVKPKTNTHCIDCKLCVGVCPMGSINYEEVSEVSGICIKCGACIKKCPAHAKYYDDENYLRHKHELEANFAYRREPELFI